ncbi:MAG: ATP-binding cassette domain-containing protein [Methyloligellaceae bacterium]
MLRIENLTPFGLEPVNLEVGSGECLGVQGASGSGKTVLLRAIADLDLSGGRVFLDATERMSLSGPEWRRRVRYSAAEPGWWAETPREHFADPAWALDRLAALGLEASLLDRPLARLSTGERQRLALVRAMEGDPDVLLLDEPTGPLDAEATAKVEALLTGCLREGKAILLVSHEPAQLRRMCRRAATLAKGRMRVKRL